MFSYPLKEEGRARSSQSLSPLHSGFSAPETPDIDSTYAERTRCKNVLQQHTNTHTKYVFLYVLYIYRPENVKKLNTVLGLEFGGF